MIVHINKIFKSLTVFAAVCCCISAQNIYINELMSSNNSTLYDESGNSSDWIELYNAGDIEIDLTGFGLSDDINDPFKWVFPGVVVSPQSFLIVFASGDDVVSNVQHWETVINWGDSWRYFIGNSNPPSDWREQEFDDSVWSIGDSGFGYGDGDDATEVPQVMSVFVRNTFQVGSVDDIATLVLHIDYDDAFVAYLNGSEIARANIGTPGVVPNYDEGANAWREAEIYSGGSPERYDIDTDSGLLTNGENVLAIQVHNYNITSSDMSLIPFFTLGMFQPPESPSGTPDILNFPLANLHTNFKIASDGEAILLTNSSGAMEDMADSTVIPTDISYGRQPDGGNTWSFFPEPTPQGPNNTQGFGDYCETPQISHQGGFYPGPVIVTLSIESDNHQIYYTLDGSMPTESSSHYSQPVLIQSTKVIRAAVIDNECFPGEVITYSYFINEESTLPVVSLTTDPYNLWDEEYGIYVLGNDAEWSFPYFGANFWEDWERPIHVELYEPNGELGFNLDAGVKIFGGWSRGWPQKSLAIYARSNYGASEINYQIFPDKEIDSFSAIVLRNSGNDWFGSGEGSATMLRDGTHTGLMDNTDIDHQAYRPAAVYINGEYWGIHNIREKVNEEFLASNNPGVDPDELDELEANAGIIEGDNQDYLNMIDFVENNDLSYSNNYDFVAEQVDVDNFIDYYIIQIYVGNTDWPGNNIKYWRPHIEGAKWKWILYDTDFGSGLFSGWSSNVNHNTLLFALDDNGPGWPNPPWSTLLFRSLMENEEFQNKFINHFCYYLNTRFYPNYVVNHISEIADNIAPEMPYHVSRWGGNIGQWNQNIIYVQEFGSQRADIVFDHIGNYFGLGETSNLYISASPLGAGMITISGLTITEHSPILSGEYFNDIPIEINATSNPGHTFSHWIGSSEPGEDISVTLEGNLNLTAVFVEDDSPGLSVFFNEILATNDTTNTDESGEYDDWLELYNAGDEPADLGGLHLTDDLDNLTKWVIPEGTEIEPHDFILFWCDEDQDQGELHTNFKLSSGGEFLGLVGIDGATILDSITFGDQSADISYGRVFDGGTNWDFLSPTPGTANSSSGTEISISHAGDWNLIGLPLYSEDTYYQYLFPESISGTLYSFDGTYILEESLTEGNGYWLRFNNAGSTIITGTPINEITISLNEGWNLISGISGAVDVASISDPGSVVVPGTVYGFTGTYSNTSVISPGKGYWLRTYETGEITLTSGSLAKSSSMDLSLKGKANYLTVNGAELYFGIELSDVERLSYSLPPKPPEGAFDVRFKEGSKVVNDYGEIEVMSSSESLSIVYDIQIDAGDQYNWILRPEDGEGYVLENTGEIVIPSSERYILEKESALPETFSLYQNYPNPFNPITTLRYDLPEQALVELTIYDMLGREVTQLVNTSQTAGFKSVKWNATDRMGRPVSAGVYLYQIQAGAFVQTKKMVLLK